MKLGKLVLFFDELLNSYAVHVEPIAAVTYFFRDKHTPSGAVAQNDDGTIAKRLIINFSEVTQPNEGAPKRDPTDSVNSAPAGSLNGSVLKKYVSNNIIVHIPRCLSCSHANNYKRTWFTPIDEYVGRK